MKAKASLALRSIAILFLCFAVASAGMVWRSKEVELLILADRSQSMENNREKTEDLIQEIQAALPKNYALGVIAFGENSQIEAPFGGGTFGRFQQQIRRDATNLQQALNFGSGYFSPDAAKQLLILTDGRDNQGDVHQLGMLLDNQGVQIDAFVYPVPAIGDAQVTELEIPEIVYLHEQFDIQVAIDSETEKNADLLLYSGNQLLSQQSVNLQKGTNRFVFQDLAQETGLVDYRAVLQERSGLVQNNQKTTVARVLGAPNLLLVEGATGEGQELSKMLAASGLSAETIQPQSFPESLGHLQGYEGVLLVNVNALDLSEAQTGSLDQFVKTMGKGLVVLGGDNSYALGGYIGSPLEAMLPVESDVRNKLDVPSMAMVMAIDHSGSMSSGINGLSRLDLAKEAAQEAVEQLTPQDQVGVIAFSDRASWIAPLQSAENTQEIQDLIGGLSIGGGTMMYSSIAESYTALRKSDAAIKHLILLTDGEPADNGFEDLVAEMYEEGITVSGVAMGADANVGLMERLSTLGGGRFYHVDSSDNVPAIFAKETQLSTQSYLQNRSFYPEYLSPSPLTADFSEGLPKLTGFLATVAKPTATVALQSDNALPILTQWQYGAGQVVAWTSDTAGIWTEDYLSWPRSAAFFSGFLSNVLKEDQGQGYAELTDSQGQGSIRFYVEGRDHADTTATVVAPDGSSIQVPLYLEKPGEFIGSFPTDQEGVYAVKIEQTEQGETVNSLESGLSKSYAPEYDNRQSQDGQSLRYLLNVGHGEILDSIEPLFQRALQPVTRRLDLTLPCLLLGLLFFFLDILSRRLQWEARAEKLWAAWLRRFSAAQKAFRALRRPSDGDEIPVGSRPQRSAEETGDTSRKTDSPAPKGGKPSKQKKSKSPPKQDPDSPGVSSELLARRQKKQ